MILLFLWSQAVFAQPFDKNALIRMIFANDRPLKTIEQVLEILPEEMWRNYVLMHASGSEQEASYENPRVILYSPTTGLIVAFNGAASQKGFDKLELIQWQTATKTFEFQEIKFDYSHKTDPRPGAASCINCHAAGAAKELRPNWEPYGRARTSAIWPGAFLAFDDQTRQYKQGPGFQLEDVAEMTKIRAFVAGSKDHSRYKHLKTLEQDYATPQNSDRSARHHNARFSQFLALLNNERILQYLQKSPSYSRWKYATVAAILCDWRKDSFLPAGITLANQEMEDPIDWQLAKVFELSGMDMSRFYLSIDGKKRTIEGPQYSLNDLVYKLLQADPELAAVVTPAVKFKHYMGNYPDLPNYVLATGTDLTAPCAA